MWSQWYKLNDKSNSRGFIIKRYRKMDGKTKWESLPVAQYGDLSAQEIEALLRRLNVTNELKERENIERYNFDHAYINIRVLEKYEDFMSSRANDKNHVNTMMTYLAKYCIDYFVVLKKLPDPQQWFKIEHNWGLWLVNDMKLSASTIRQVTQNTNRFCKFLATKMFPEKLTIPSLDPVSRNKLKKIKSDSVVDEHHYISEDDFNEIIRHMKVVSPGLVPNVLLAYHFGLRISETLGLTEKKLFKKYLLVNEQGIGCKNGVVVRGDVKTIDYRKTPYWYMAPDEAHSLIKKILPMHPDTLGRKLNEILNDFNHQTHDFRKSFVTKALRDHHWRDVQMAVGHSDINTTMRYAQDDRELDDEVWIPTKGPIVKMDITSFS